MADPLSALLLSLPRVREEADDALLQRFRDGRDQAAFAALVGRHGATVFNVCRRVLGDAADAEDAFQATFLVLTKKAAAVRPGALPAFLHGVARRVALKVRSSRLRPPAPPPPTPTDDPLERLTVRELLDALDEEIAALPEVFRSPVLLCCLEGLSREEAARRLGWSPGSVKGRLERGRRLLQERLTRRGFTLAAALAATEVVRAAVPARCLAAGTTGAAAALAEAVLGEAARPRLAAVAALLVGVGVSMMGMFAIRHGEERPAQEARPPMPPTPRLDRHGDPLPDGALARLGTLRLRGSRDAMAFAPDGKILASNTGSAGQTITLWDVATGRATRVLADAGQPTLASLAFSADGRRLVAVSNSSFSYVWDIAAGTTLYRVPGNHAAFSGDGKALASADSYGAEPKVRVHDAATGKVVREFACPGGAQLLAVAGDTLALARGHGPPPFPADGQPWTVEVWDLTTGAVRSRLPREKKDLRHLAISGDGSRLATAGSAGVTLWDAATGKERRSWAVRTDSRLAFSADGKRLAWTGYDGIAYLWTVSLDDDDKPRRLGRPTNHFGAPAFSPDGRTVAVVGDGGAIDLRDAQTGDSRLAFDAHASPVTQLAVTDDGRGVVSGDRNGVSSWDVATARVVQRFGNAQGDAESVSRLLPPGRLLTTDRAAGLARVRDAMTGRETMRFHGRFDVGGGGEPTASANGRFLVLRDKQGSACVVESATGRLLYQLDPTVAFAHPHVSGDGRLLAGFTHVPGQPSAPCVRDPDTGRLRVHPVIKEDDLQRGYHLRLYSEGLSPDARRLAVVGQDNVLRCLDLLSGKETKLGPAQSQVWGVTWSPDGRLVATRGSAAAPGVIDREAPRTLRIWDVDAGVLLAHLDVPPPPTEALLFSHDGRTLFAPEAGGTIALWEVATGKRRRTLPGHGSAFVGSLAPSRDGRVLVSGGYDTQVLVWDLTGRGRGGRPSAEERNRAWEALGGDAEKAYRALWLFADDPEGTTAFLRERLRPAPRPDAARVARLVAQLDDDDFAIRRRAAADLESFGGSIVADLRWAIEKASSAEARRALTTLADRLSRPGPEGEELRQVRAVEALEYAGAAAPLEALAGGAPGARLTEEAKRSLQRLRGARK